VGASIFAACFPILSQIQPPSRSLNNVSEGTSSSAAHGRRYWEVIEKEDAAVRNDAFVVIEGAESRAMRDRVGWPIWLTLAIPRPRNAMSHQFINHPHGPVSGVCRPDMHLPFALRL
jgi:hypothetical protein